MTDWNLEASEDGKTWTTLHEARYEENQMDPRDSPTTNLFCDKVRNSDLPQDEANKALLNYVEKHHRHTWKIKTPSPTFYRYFRLIGKGLKLEDLPGLGIFDPRCMHPCGLEFYGEVYEA